MSKLNRRLIGLLLLAIPPSRSGSDDRLERLLQGYDLFRDVFYRMSRESPPLHITPKDIVRHLHGMREMGLIEYAGVPDHRAEPRLSRWRLTAATGRDDAPPPDGNRSNGGRNDGGRGNTGGNDQGGNDDGRGGIREILSHPILFALPEPEFDNWINGLFEGENT